MITFSERESELFKLRFGRYEGPMYDATAMRNEILDGSYDFVRLKLTDPNGELFVHLEQVGFPYLLLDIHRLYDLDLTTYEVPAQKHPEVTFEPCDGSQKELYAQLVRDTYTELPMGFFKHALLEKYFPVQAQIENFAHYMAQHFIERGNPGKQGWLIKLNGAYIGCCATEFKGEFSYTPYIGLLPQYRKKNLFTDVARYLQRAMKEGGCRYATGAARLHNIASQVNFEREGQKYTRHDYVFMLTPMLSL